MTTKPIPHARKARRSKKQRLARAALVSVVLSGVMGYGFLRVPWVAPLCADIARKVVGPAAVAKLEDKAYGLADSYNQWRYKGTPPASYWASSSAAPSAASTPPPTAGPPASTDDGGALVPLVEARAFPPADFTPAISSVAGKADGKWIALADDVEPAAPTVMAKTLVHPDAARSYAQVAIVAIDLAGVRISAVPGTEEPASTTVKREERPGKIPDTDQPRLIAAFNGGWQAIHGGFGMMVDGRELLPPKEPSCTIVLYKNRGMRIAPWLDVAEERESMQAFRQTPPCLVTAGVENTGLSEGSKSWGAAVDGATVIRRSALGLAGDRKTLFYGSGDSLSALTLAQAMKTAGAVDVAELDVNWSFPRFLFYKHGDAIPEVRDSLIPCSFRKNEHTGISYHRDYFYVVREAAIAQR